MSGERAVVSGKNPDGPGSVRDLVIWQEGMAVVETVYRLTGEWPKAEVYGLTSQARRAAVSIPANIAEGSGRGSPGEWVRFSRIALGSAYELMTLIEISVRLKMTPPDTAEPLQTALGILTRRLNRFIQVQESRK